jgi:hypothetical protein
MLNRILYALSIIIGNEIISYLLNGSKYQFDIIGFISGSIGTLIGILSIPLIVYYYNKWYPTKKINLPFPYNNSNGEIANDETLKNVDVSNVEK